MLSIYIYTCMPSREKNDKIKSVYIFIYSRERKMIVYRDYYHDVILSLCVCMCKCIYIHEAIFYEDIVKKTPFKNISNTVRSTPNIHLTLPSNMWFFVPSRDTPYPDSPLNLRKFYFFIKLNTSPVFVFYFPISTDIWRISANDIYLIYIYQKSFKRSSIWR